VVLVGKTTKTEAAEGTLLAQLTTFDVVRHSSPETRSKAYVDHTEVVANPAYSEAKGRAAMALTSLNGAIEQLRAVQEAQNEALRTLQQSREQLAELEKTVAADDARWYASRASPCQDGKLTCAETRGRQQWGANLAFYRAAIAKDEARVRELEPEQTRLQGVVDDRQGLYDAAQKLLAETPPKSKRDVMLPHNYTVMNHSLKVAAKLVVRWRERGRDVALSEVQQDDAVRGLSNERVEVNGVLLEAAKSSEIPDDAALAPTWANRLLDAAMPPVLESLAKPANRWLQQADLAKDDLAKLDALVVAAQARQALAADGRQRLLAALLDKAGWDPDTDRFDLTRLAPQLK
jgi:hypothetical protein